MTLDWKAVRDQLVPEVPTDDPALVLIYARLRYLDACLPLDGNDPVTGRPWSEFRVEFRQYLTDEMERYGWRRAGFHPTQEVLDACREDVREP